MKGHTGLEREESEHRQEIEKRKQLERNTNTQKEQESLLEDDKEVQLVKATAQKQPCALGLKWQDQKRLHSIFLQGMGEENQNFLSACC